MLTAQAAPSRFAATFPRLAALPRDSRDTLFLLFVIGWVILPQVGNLPGWCSALAAGVLVWRGTLAWRSRPLPSSWWVVGLLAITVAATLATHRTLLGRDAGVTMTVVLLTLKTLELRARRDAFVIFFLSFFVMLTNFFFSQSLLVALAMLIALLGLLTALVNAHMPVGRPPLAQAARTAFGMAVLGAPIMALLFVLFPRIAPLWGMPGDAMAGSTGLTSTMTVGAVATLAQDDTVALRLRFEGAAPPQDRLYFRGPVLTNYDGREWTGAGSTAIVRSFPLPSMLRVSGEATRYEVTLEANRRPWIFVLEATRDEPVVPGYELTMTPDLQWITNRPVSEIVRYKATSYLDFAHGPERRLPGLAAYLQQPDGYNPRTRQLAGEIRAQVGANDTERLVAAVMEKLRTGGYTYTLEPGVYGRDTADEFWFDKKQGFCEHIASAFVLLMRAMDVPARVVTGYQGGELNAVDGFWTVRQSDAHAWAEVWMNGRGWVRVDPTQAVAPGRIGSSTRLLTPRGVFTNAMDVMSPGLAARLRAGWEAVNNSWNQWVLNYTQTRQLDLLRNLGFQSPSWEDLVMLILTLLVGASVAGAVWSLWEKSRHDPWLRLLGRATRRLERAGIAAPPPAAPRTLAQLVRSRFGDAAQPVHDWLLRLESLRYAKPDAASAQTLAGLRREFRGLRWPQGPTPS